MLSSCEANHQEMENVVKGFDGESHRASLSGAEYAVKDPKYYESLPKPSSGPDTDVHVAW